MEAKGEEIMAMLILNNKGAHKVPNCDCGSRMLPKDLEAESGVWKCPYCMKEKEIKDRK